MAKPKDTAAPATNPNGLVVATHYGSGMGNIRVIVDNLGGRLVDVVSTKQAATIRFDRLILLGGGDIDPFWYGEATRGAHYPDVGRDNVEWTLLRRALSQRIPVMGICRGHQMLAVGCGGSLYQDIGYDHGMLGHDITGIHPRLAAHLAVTKVNSYHHQSIKRMPFGFSIAAKSPDGIIEAIYRPGMLGVQFHPEFLISTDASLWKLFGWFMQGLDQRDGPEAERFERHDRTRKAAPPSALTLPTEADIAEAIPASTYTAAGWRNKQGTTYRGFSEQGKGNFSHRNGVSRGWDNYGYFDRKGTWHNYPKDTTTATNAATTKPTNSQGSILDGSWDEDPDGMYYRRTSGEAWKRSEWPGEDDGTTKVPTVTGPKLLGAIDQARVTPTATGNLAADARTSIQRCIERAEAHSYYTASDFTGLLDQAAEAATRNHTTVSEEIEAILDAEEAAENAAIAADTADLPANVTEAEYTDLDDTADIPPLSEADRALLEEAARLNGQTIDEYLQDIAYSTSRD